MSSAAAPIRILTVVPLCDGHDSAISTINLELVHHGVEVVYLGYHRSVRDIVRAAIQEDVRAVGISSYNGGHVEFFSAVVFGLRHEGASDIGVFGGGGGTITRQDAVTLRRRGVDRIFFPGEPLSEIVRYVHDTYRDHRNGTNGHARSSPDRLIAKRLIAAEQTRQIGRHRPARLTHGQRRPLVIGITGPGGAGKTTLIDELVLRFLRSDPARRIAILSHDPSLIGSGALLGDRASMIYSQSDRVFMRSLASRGQGGGLSPATAACLKALTEPHVARAARPCLPSFDVLLIETTGIGQEALPFAPGQVDRAILVMSPDYGAALQLQKIAMLDLADIVVLNKSDLSQAQTAATEIQHRLDSNGRGQRLLTTIAKRHNDGGVHELFAMLRGTSVHLRPVTQRQALVTHA